MSGASKDSKQIKAQPRKQSTVGVTAQQQTTAGRQAKTMRETEAIGHATNAAKDGTKPTAIRSVRTAH
jgi:hypothetical protein